MVLLLLLLDLLLVSDLSAGILFRRRSLKISKPKAAICSVRFSISDGSLVFASWFVFIWQICLSFLGFPRTRIFFDSDSDHDNEFFVLFRCLEK